MRESETGPDISSSVSLDELPSGEWVLARVLGLDEDRNISRVEVLHHSLNRKEVSKALRSIHKSDPGAHLTILLAGSRPGSGDEFQEALKRIADEDYVNARW